MKVKKTKQDLKKFEISAKQLHQVRGGKFKAGSDLADAVQAP
jgi:hypothetical protein